MPTQRATLSRTQQEALAARAASQRRVAEWKKEAALQSTITALPSSHSLAAAQAMQSLARAAGRPVDGAAAAVSTVMDSASPLAQQGKGSMRNLRMTSRDSARLYARTLKEASDRRSSSRDLRAGLRGRQ